MSAVLNERGISLIASGFDVAPLVKQLADHPELWNEHTLRTDRYNTPHNEVSDIWVRYNAWENYDGDPVKFTMEPHLSAWYPCITKIPSAWSLARKVMKMVGGKKLGGVLLTRIPPHGEVKAHIDSGWHASHYEKFAVHIKGNRDQVFWVGSDDLRTVQGDVFQFDNSIMHGVKNNSDEERISLICCIRR